MTTTATLAEPADAVCVLSMEVGRRHAEHRRALALGVSMSALWSPSPLRRAVRTGTVAA